MARRLLGALAAAALVVAGCGGQGDPSPPPSTASATGGDGPASVTGSPAPPTYPNARPGESPPVRPVDVLSDEGAEAFARYFMQTVDWAYASMDSTLMRAEYDAATCAYCNQAAKRTDADRAAGKRYEGGRSHIIDVMSAHGADTANNLVLIVFDADPVKAYDSSGNVVSDTPVEVGLRFNLRARYVDGWTISEVKRLIPAS